MVTEVVLEETDVHWNYDDIFDLGMLYSELKKQNRRDESAV